MKTVVTIHWLSLVVVLLGMALGSMWIIRFGFAGCVACGMIRLFKEKR